MIQPLIVSDLFLSAMDQAQRRLDDMQNPIHQLQIRSASLERQYVAPRGSSDAPSEAPRERCGDAALADRFLTAMTAIEPLPARACRHHFLISSYASLNEPWDKVARHEARYFKLSPEYYALQVQRGVDLITERLC